MQKNQLTERLRALRERAGLSQAAMAEALGGAYASTYARYEDPKKVKRLTYEWLVKVARVLVGRGNPPISQDEVMELRLLGPDGKVENLRQKNRVDKPADIGFDMDTATASRVPVAPYLPGADYIPLLGTRAGREPEVHEMMDRPIGRAQRPPELENREDVYAMHCRGRSMEPRYFQGNTLFVDPNFPPQLNDGVIVYLAGERRMIVIKTYVRQTDTDLWVREHFPVDREFPIPLDQVAEVHTIVAWQR